MEYMWDNFTDFELVTLAGQYDLDICEFDDNLNLVNRAKVEKLLTKYELTEAFGE